MEFSEEHKQKLKEAWKKRKEKGVSQETRNKMSKSKQNRKRKPLTDAQKKRISEATKKAMARPEVKEKYKKAISTPEYKAKRLDSFIKNNGCTSAFCKKEVQEKIKQTNTKRYGAGHVWSNASTCRAKRNETMKNRYGVVHAGQLQQKFVDRCNLSKEDIITNYIINNQIDINSICNDYNMSIQWVVHCINELGINKPLKLTKCRSKEQKNIYDYVTQFAEAKNDDRKTLDNYKELDIFIKSYNFAIEYDGLLYHSFGHLDIPWLDNTNEYKNIHLDKTIECENKNIQLYHIFENEWFEKQDIWKSMILCKLQKVTRLYARKCKVKIVNNKESKEFLNANHMQGSCICSVRLGLYYEDELVSLMTFGKPRYSKVYEYELTRFCSKLNHTVVGGASKLLKHFIDNYKPKSLISYANRRWSNGNLYEKLGFKLSHYTQPNYYYFNSDGVLHSRLKFQKHKLSNVLEKFDSSLTETENMYNNGYRKIFDCGNAVYTLYI